MDGQMDRSVLRAAWSQLKIQYDHQAAILKVTSLKNKMFLPTATSTRNFFETEIPKQTWVMLQKPCHLQSIQMKNPIWLPGSHFENDCHWKSMGFSAYGHNKHAHEIWSWNSKANSENHVVYRQTDRQDESSIHTPIQLHWVGYNEKNFGQICTHERHPIACP